MKYRKALQRTGLRVAYERALNDPQLTSVRDELALLEAREAQLLERLPPGGSFKAASKAFAALQRAIEVHDSAAIASAWQVLKEQIDAGASSDQTWQDLLTVIEERRKLAESEAKRLIGMRAMISVEQAMEFVRRVALVVREHMGLVHCPQCNASIPTRREMGDMMRTLALMMSHNGNKDLTPADGDDSSGSTH